MMPAVLGANQYVRWQLSPSKEDRTLAEEAATANKKIINSKK
jgi:hypothetical protein